MSCCVTLPLLPALSGLGALSWARVMQSNMAGRGRATVVSFLAFFPQPHLSTQAVGRAVCEWEQGFSGHTTGWATSRGIGRPIYPELHDLQQSIC